MPPSSHLLLVPRVFVDCLCSYLVLWGEVIVVPLVFLKVARRPFVVWQLSSACAGANVTIPLPKNNSAVRAIVAVSRLSADVATPKLRNKAAATGFPPRTRQSTECFGANVTVPIPVERIMKRAGYTKRAYFKILYNDYIHDTATMLVQGGADRLDASCVRADTEMVFIGDSIIRGMFDAWAARHEYNSSSSRYVPWGGVEKLENVIAQEIRPSTSTILWTGHYVHSWFEGPPSWHDDVSRSRHLLSLFRYVQNYQLMKVIWVSPPHVNTRIMQAKPPKPGYRKFLKLWGSIVGHARVFADIDRRAALKWNVVFLDRLVIDLHFTGIMCDGLHTNKDRPEWGCHASPAIEEIVLQKGLYALCRPEYEFRICTSRAAIEESHR